MISSSEASARASSLAAKTEVMVEVCLYKLKLAEHVDVTDPQTIAGLQTLAASGLLTEARVQEVLR